MMDCTRTINGYEIGETLGAGLQGKVKQGVHAMTGEIVALKIIDREKLQARELQNLQREITSMKIVQHPNIIALKEVDHNARYPKKDGSSKEVILLVLELATGGELFDFMMYTGCFKEQIARTYFRQLITGLHVCHQKGVYHRDIKPENLLLDGDFMLKIADFGLSALHEDGDGSISMLHTECGTKGYMAPEILAHCAYDGAKADVWSAGVVLFIMLSGFPPFQIAAQSDWWFRAVSRNQYEAFWNAHLRSAQYSPGAMRLMSRIFCAEPNNRIRIAEIMEDPWFNESSISMEVLAADLQRRQQEVEREKRKEKEAERRKKEAEMRARQGAQEFDPFQKNIFRAIPGAEEAAAAAAAEKRPPAIAASQVGTHVASYTTFHTRGEAPADVYGRLGQALSPLCVEYKSNDALYKLKATARTPQGKVDFVAQVLEVEEGKESEDGVFHLVSVKRRNGNMMNFQDIYKKLESSLSDIIVPSPSVEQEDSSKGKMSAAEEDDLSEEVSLL